MSASRVIKPEFFLNEDLYNLETRYGLPLRLAYAGLWTCCDREGRFLWRPKRLGRDVLPYDDVDFSEVLDCLASEGYVVRYEGLDIRGIVSDFGVVPKFKLHQHLNNKEPLSEIPPPPDGVEMLEPGRRRTGPKAATVRLADLLNSNQQKIVDQALLGKIDSAVEDVAVSHLKWITSGGSIFRVEEGVNSVLCADKNDTSDSIANIVTCSKGIEVGISEKKAAQYSVSYGGIDVKAELIKISQWSIDNAQNRKTPTGMTKFINGWMGRAQNSGGRGLPLNRSNQYQGSTMGQSKADAARELMGFSKVNVEVEVIG